MKVYLVFYLQDCCYPELVTVCSTEGIAHDLGSSFCDRRYQLWMHTWEHEHGLSEAWKPKGYPQYQVKEIELDQRSINLLLVDLSNEEDSDSHG